MQRCGSAKSGSSRRSSSPRMRGKARPHSPKSARRTGAAAGSEGLRYWSRPLVAAIGYSASVLHVYSIGPFMQHLQAAFGWNRAQISAGAAIVNIVGAVGALPIGVLIDRFGPRRLALAG